MAKIKRKKLVKLINRTKNEQIDNIWLHIGFLGTNIDGCLGRLIPTDSMFTEDERFPDTLSEIQNFLGHVMTVKRLMLIRQCSVNPEIVHMIHQLEENPQNIWQIFNEHRHIFDIKKKSNNQSKEDDKEKYNTIKKVVEKWLSKEE
ncbi:MAG: hypothetical protein MJ170_00910 [Alphaproteobacteria bacterium]|nr:hypothetical protein [Alphaproteobacteria bacterium]